MDTSRCTAEAMIAASLPMRLLLPSLLLTSCLELRRQHVPLCLLPLVAPRRSISLLFCELVMILRGLDIFVT